ncbi:hypothetical protein Celal_3486 [Cellulophaga algicola DSM 14237]|uniref:DUF4907 domain-containing protein n=1 Tax=Cellulophaga algicola (strain DSM 14237 / IC166 / ACAM 630) TaxID=688270 RepID=E6X7P0_CELAD|nr:DUF4907 domain-containing protein [Cellulophaga algicola]ADV50750.1 hypothetical protein Celal_3486 [Cellulophaga algicola DSM 14237]
MKKSNLDKTITLAAFTIALITIVMVIMNYMDSKPILDSEVFTVEGGFGYQIQAEDKIIIKQEYIPAIQGAVPFNTKNDAWLVSNLVINKLLNKENPVVTLNDLENLNIKVLNRQ